MVGIKSKKPQAALERLEARGWLASLSKRVRCLRVVIHHHLTEKSMGEFVKDLAEIERSL
jgi:hypothetical protein